VTGFENLSGLKFVTLANQEIRIFQKIEFLNSFNPPFHLKDIGGQQKHVAHPTLTAAFPSCSIMIRSPIKVRLMSSGKRSFDRGMRLDFFAQQKNVTRPTILYELCA